MRDKMPPMSLTRFHPVISEWFTSQVGQPTDVQLRAWPAIQSGTDALIAAPTGSGKTLAAFLSCIDQLFKQALARELDDHTHVLYVSPLKALSNDIQKNLQKPLAEIGQLALQAGLLMPELRVLGPYRRHPDDGSSADAETAAAYPRHDSGVALHLIDCREEPKALADGAHGDRGRDSCAGTQQARGSSGAVVGTAGSAHLHETTANWPFGDATADRTGRRFLVGNRALSIFSVAALSTSVRRSSTSGIAVNWISRWKCRRTS